MTHLCSHNMYTKWTNQYLQFSHMHGFTILVTWTIFIFFIFCKIIFTLCTCVLLLNISTQFLHLFFCWDSLRANKLLCKKGQDRMKHGRLKEPFYKIILLYIKQNSNFHLEIKLFLSSNHWTIKMRSSHIWQTKLCLTKSIHFEVVTLNVSVLLTYL